MLSTPVRQYCHIVIFIIVTFICCYHYYFYYLSFFVSTIYRLSTDDRREHLIFVKRNFTGWILLLSSNRYCQNSEVKFVTLIMLINDTSENVFRAVVRFWHVVYMVQLDDVTAPMIVCRVREKIIRWVLCSIVWTVQCATPSAVHTHEPI